MRTVLLVFSIIYLCYLSSVNCELRRLPPDFSHRTRNVRPSAPANSPSDNWNPWLGEGIAKGQFVSSKVAVTLNCKSNETVVNLNFTDPFKGVIQVGDSSGRITSNNNNNVGGQLKNTCRIRGDNSRNYSLRVPHNGCGTRHVVSTGSFFNTLFIRYHPSLEMEGDHLKSIVCKFGTASVFVG